MKELVSTVSSSALSYELFPTTLTLPKKSWRETWQLTCSWSHMIKVLDMVHKHGSWSHFIWIQRHCNGSYMCCQCHMHDPGYTGASLETALMHARSAQMAVAKSKPGLYFVRAKDSTTITINNNNNNLSYKNYNKVAGGKCFEYLKVPYKCYSSSSWSISPATTTKTQEPSDHLTTSTG